MTSAATDDSKRSAKWKERRDAIVDCMAGYFPEARPRGYHPGKDAATFEGRKHAYVAVYEEHGDKRAVDAA